MGFAEIRDKILERISNRKSVFEREDIPDDVTTDKVLRSLRRQRRLQIEEKEKIRLRKTIALSEKNRTAEMLFGIKRPMSKKTILQEGQGIKAMGNFMAAKKRKIKAQQGFFGKGNL